MEKVCEFCTALRPVVYCQADAAYLCLSCDAKVHSANALSNKHLRTLLCDSCRHHPAHAWCLDHRMFVCRSCDHSLHGLSSQHQKRLVSSYVGCPSAKDFAALWGIGLDELDRTVSKDPSLSISRAYVQRSEENIGFSGQHIPQARESSVMSTVSSTLVCDVESEMGSSSQKTEISYKGQQQQDACFILKQILDLKKLQLTEVNNGLSAMSTQGQTDIVSSTFGTVNKHLDNLVHLRHRDGVGTDLQQIIIPVEELKADPFTLPFCQPESLPFPSTIVSPLIGESFWQCKSPIQSSQLWSQNMQDLGFCEDNLWKKDFDIPDVDITFSNFEELFEGDEDLIGALLDDKDLSCSSVERNLSLDRSDNSNRREKEDVCASSIYIGQSIKTDEEDLNQVYSMHGSLNPRCSLRPSYSSLSLTCSRNSNESSGTEYHDSGLSPCATRAEASCDLPELEEGPHLEARNALTKYKEKRKSRMNENKVRHDPRRYKSDARKRVRDQLVKTEEGYDSDSIGVAARSY